MSKHLQCEECDEEINGKINIPCVFYEVALCESCARKHIRECLDCK